MKCKNCPFTLPCNAGFLNMNKNYDDEDIQILNISLCPSCGKFILSYVNTHDLTLIIYGLTCAQHKVTSDMKRHWGIWDKSIMKDLPLFDTTSGMYIEKCPVCKGTLHSNPMITWKDLDNDKK